MTMAKSKQIDFSLQSNFENSDRQENVNNQAIFTENSQMKRVSFTKISNNTISKLLRNFHYFHFYQVINESGSSFSEIILETFWKLSFIKILLFDIGISLGDSVTDLLQATRQKFIKYLMIYRQIYFCRYKPFNVFSLMYDETRGEFQLTTVHYGIYLLLVRSTLHCGKSRGQSLQELQGSQSAHLTPLV